MDGCSGEAFAVVGLPTAQHLRTIWKVGANENTVSRGVRAKTLYTSNNFKKVRIQWTSSLLPRDFLRYAPCPLRRIRHLREPVFDRWSWLPCDFDDASSCRINHRKLGPSDRLPGVDSSANRLISTDRLILTDGDALFESQEALGPEFYSARWPTRSGLLAEGLKEALRRPHIQAQRFAVTSWEAQPITPLYGISASPSPCASASGPDAMDGAGPTSTSGPSDHFDDGAGGIIIGGNAETRR